MPIEPTDIRREPRPGCPVCGGSGIEAFAALTDRWFGAPGTWRMVRCADAGCGTLWLDPGIAAGDLGLAYASYYTHGVATRSGPVYRFYRLAARRWLAQALGYRRDPAGACAGIVFDAARREELRHTVLYLAAPAGRVCDVGCGDGSRLQRLAELGWSGAGVEPDPRAVARARALGFDVREGTLEEQRYDDASFDAVTIGHVIEHVPDPLATLRAARRVLAPGGRLAVATPNANSLGARRWGAGWRGLEPPRHLQVFTPGSLLAVARRAGFDAARVRTTARMAGIIDLESRTGRIAMGGAAFEAGLRRQAAKFAAEERALLARDPEAGEEIVLEAKV